MSDATQKWFEQVSNVTVLGAGTMGHGIAQVFAMAGYNVTLEDVDERILQRALARIASNLDTFVENGLATRQAKRKALARIKVTTEQSAAVRDAHVVIEAIPEDLVLKQQVFRDVERVVSPDTIIASNSSSFPITDTGALCQQRDRLVVAHWFNPPHIVPLVEVVKGQHTSQETMERTHTLMRKLGKRPVKIYKETPGFVANRMQMALAREALSLLDAGVASAEDIDTAVKTSFGFRLPTLGVFETLDLAGLDVYLSIAGVLLQDIESSRETPKRLKELVDQGKFGAKTGEGIYQWPKERLEALIKERDRQFLQRFKQLYAEKP